MSRFPFLTQPKVINQTTAISSYVNFRPRGRGRGENVTTSLAVEYFFNKGPYRFTPAPTLWYKIRHAGPHVKQRDIQNKTTRASQAWLSFVFNVPLPNLRPCMADFVPCDPASSFKGRIHRYPFPTPWWRDALWEKSAMPCQRIKWPRPCQCSNPDRAQSRV